MRIASRFFLFAFCATAMLLTAQDETPRTFPTLKEFQERLAPLAKISSVWTDCVQTRAFKELDFSMEQRGYMALEQNKRLLWAISSPIATKSLFTPKEMRQWDAQTRTVTRVSAAKFPWLKIIFDTQTAWMSGDLQELQKSFALTVRSDYTLCLTPLRPEMKAFFSHIVVTFSHDYTAVESVLFTEPTGDTLHIVFSNARRNTPIPADIWDLQK